MDKQDLKIPDIPGVSLVAYYRNKPDKLSLLIQSTQHKLKQIYGDNFIAYDLDQIHGTIIGCEGVKTSQGIVNKWFYQLRNEVKYADFAGLLAYLRRSELFPLQIRFTGYQQDLDYQFLSRGKHPSDRSFQLQTTNDNQLIPILIGWPITQQQINTDLQRIRYDCQQHNFLHKYHQKPSDIDNDFYFRLGTITNSLNINKNLEAETMIRDCLEKTAPLLIELRKKNLSLVKYQDLVLSLNSTKFYPFDQLNLSNDFINYLYQ